MTDAKKILFVNQHYYPDIAATGQKLTDLAEYLAEQGHEVSVFCSQGHYLAGAMRVSKTETRNSVQIERIGATSFGRSTTLGRLVDYASFYVKVFLKLLFLQKYDYTVWLTTPPLLCVAAAALKMLRRQPYGIWSMDLHPDAEEALGMLSSSSLLSRVLNGLNNWGYRSADFVVDLGEYMKARILKKGVSREKTQTIPMWDRLGGEENMIPENNNLRQQLGLQEKFVVMYAGNAGLAHRFDEVLEVMRRLKDHPQIYFLFVGNGPRKFKIQAFAKAHGIKNFQYLDYFVQGQRMDALAMADLHLLTLREEMAGIAVPCKLYGIMAAGRPVAMVGPTASEPACTILEEEAGCVIDPGIYGPETAEQLLQAILKLSEQRSHAAYMGWKGRKAFEARYSSEASCRMWAQLITKQQKEALEPVS